MGPEYQQAEKRVLLRYGAAVAVVLVAAGVRYVLQPAMGVAPPYITFYLAVAAAAAFGGWGPGVLATVLGGLFGVSLAVGPEHRLHFGSAAEQIRLVLYLLSGTTISWIAARMHRARYRSMLEAEKLQQTTEQLRVANERLSESDRSKDRFVALVAHELRNPLTPLGHGVRLLRERSDDVPTVRKTADMMGRQVDQMVRIVNDLLDATRIRQNKLDLQRARVDLRDIVANVVDDYRQQFLARAIGLHQRKPSQPVYVHADAARMSQAVGNLLHNALKFTPDRGDVYVDLEADHGRALLRVRDTGMGIPPELLPRIFEPFEQGEQTSAQTRGGLGLGLALVKTIVSLHGGTIEPRSAGRQQGAEFLVQLPLDVMPSVHAPLCITAGGAGHQDDPMGDDAHKTEIGRERTGGD